MTWLLSTCITTVFAIERCIHFIQAKAFLYCKFIYKCRALTYV
jgi:hypothetical protein